MVETRESAKAKSDLLSIVVKTMLDKAERPFEYDESQLDLDLDMSIDSKTSMTSATLKVGEVIPLKKRKEAI